MPSNKETSRVSLLAHSAALIFIYSLYGYLQEKIMKSRTYGPDNLHFTSSSLLIVFNRLFSVSVGLAILFYKTRQQPENGSFVQRLVPKSPYYAYALVAAYNFLSTSAQYQALRYVSYTTQSLAKTSKMIPVLVVGAMIYKKKHMAKEWVAGGVILVGCATYLFSAPPVSHGSQAAAAGGDGSALTNALLGSFCLIAYLFFDGLVSTTQERVFGKNPSSSDPFGADSPVLDQMVWTNIFACIIAVLASLASQATGDFATNLQLLLTSAPLLWDVCIFSAASAVGLIVLLNTIASFGALTSSMIMTIRQFLSILINAGLFGNFASVSLVGWMGVFWVASGIWIKINKKYDPPKAPKIIFDVRNGGEGGDETEAMLNEKSSSSLGAPYEQTQQQKGSKVKQYAMQYLLPVAIPVILAILISPFLAPSDPLGAAIIPTTISTNLPASVGTAETVAQPAQLGTVDYADVDDVLPVVGMSSSANDTSDEDGVEEDTDSEYAAAAVPVEENVVESNAYSDETEAPTAADKEDAEQLSEAEAADAEELAVAIEGGSWDSELHKAVSPACKNEITTVPYRTKIRTGFVSYPRSGNSYLRSLVERSTGYQTSSIYCDKGLQRTFLGECDHRTNFFVKTHFPALPKSVKAGDARYERYYQGFDQAVHVVRNPLDSLVSWWHLSHAPRTAEGFQAHESKVDVKLFDEKYRKDILDLAERWRRHTVYWMNAPLLTHTLKYEDLKASPIPHMMSLLSFLLPDTNLPPLGDVACIAEHHESLQAYHSARNSDFATWDQFEPSLREEVLRIVRRPFCAFGYNRVLLNARGDDLVVQKTMENFCDSVGMEDEEHDNYAESW